MSIIVIVMIIIFIIIIITAVSYPVGAGTSVLGWGVE